MKLKEKLKNFKSSAGERLKKAGNACAAHLKKVGAALGSFFKKVGFALGSFFRKVGFALGAFFKKIGSVIASWSKKQKILALILALFFLVVLPLGLSLGLTLPIKSVVAEGTAVLLEGEEYDGGLFLVVTRVSGKKTRFEVKPYMLSPIDSSERGEHDVTVTFRDRKIAAKILVVGLEETTCSVRVGTMKTHYEPKEELSTGGILDLSYNDKPFRSFPITADMVSDFTTEKSGDYEATITFREILHCVYRYTVMKSIKSLEAVGKLYAEQGAPLTKENVMGNGSILVTYTDDTSENISIYNEFVEIRTQFLEEQETNYQTTLELSYRDQVFIFAAEAYLKGDQFAIESVELSLPKRVFKVGEKPPLDTAVLNVKYRYYTGSVRIAITEDMVENYAPFAEPTLSRDFTVSYMGFTSSVAVRVVSEEDSTRITALSTSWRGSMSSSLAVGDELSFTDASLTVEYGYGYSFKGVPLTAEMVSGYDPNVAGAQNVTLTYDGFSSELAIIVISPGEAQVVTALLGVIGWEDKTFKSDSTLTVPSGARLMVEYGYGAETGEIPLTADGVEITGFAPGVVGSQVITISYQGKSVSQYINVRDDAVEGITDLSLKMQEYLLGEAFDPARCVVVLEYQNGKRVEEKTLEELIPLGATYTFDDPAFDPETPNSYVIRVRYQDCSDFGWMIVRNVETVISGIWVDISGGKSKYAVGEGLDITGFVLNVNFSDGSSGTADLTYDMIAGFDSSEKGTFYASVSYSGQITYFAYTVE